MSIMNKTAHHNPDPDRSIIVPGALVLDRYVAEEPFGFGGTAMVWRGHVRGTERQVAIKVPHRRKRTPTQNEERLRREAQLLTRIASPYVMGIHDFGDLEDGRPVAVFEYMDGVTLRALMREQGALELPDALRLTRELMMGLRDVHRCGVVHRDIKPDNIMIEGFTAGVEARVKLFDFGIAKLITDHIDGVTTQDDPEVAGLFVPLTAAEMTVGTPEYMAPEQISASDLGGFTDIYAAGIVLHEVLFGVVPYTGKTFFEIAHRHLEGILPPLPAELPQRVQDLIWRALACDVFHRYSTADAMIHDIDAALDELEGVLNLSDLSEDEMAPWALADDDDLDEGRDDLPDIMQAAAYGERAPTPAPAPIPWSEPEPPPPVLAQLDSVGDGQRATLQHWMPWAAGRGDPWQTFITPPRREPSAGAICLDDVIQGYEPPISEEFPNDGIHDILGVDDHEDFDHFSLDASDGIHDLSLDPSEGFDDAIPTLVQPYREVIEDDLSRANPPEDDLDSRDTSEFVAHHAAGPWSV